MIWSIVQLIWNWVLAFIEKMRIINPNWINIGVILWNKLEDPS